MSSGQQTSRATDLPAMAAAGPEIRVLGRADCEAVLRRHQVGRIAYAFERQVDILPIHFVYEDGWIYGRTTASAKVRSWQHSHWVAFEVDEVRALFDWTSVVAHGGLHVLQPDVSPADAAAWEHAVTLLRRLVPETGTAHDPVPARTVVFRIHAEQLDGRAATPPRPA